MDKKKDIKGFWKFEKDWKSLDRYNDILQQISQQQEADSITRVNGLAAKNKRIGVVLARSNPLYQVEKFVDVSDDRNGKWYPIGRIAAASPDFQSFEIEYADSKVLNLLPDLEQRAAEGYSRARIRDVGFRVRLHRQRKALERLYQGRTANPRLKEILMSGGQGVACEPSSLLENELTPYLLRFQENSRQKEAFTGAVAASDLYMVQGPPGTGKTALMAELVNYLVAKEKCVLISSETHIAVDNLLERMEDQENLCPIRLGSSQDVGQEAKRYLLENRADFMVKAAQKGLKEKEEIYCDTEKLENRYLEKWNRELLAMEQKAADIRRSSGIEGLTQKDMGRITSYLQLLDQCMKEYQEYQKRRADWEAYEEKHSRLNDQKGAVLAELKEEQGCLEKTEGVLLVLKDRKEKRITELKREEARLDKLLSQNCNDGLEAAYLEIRKQYQESYRKLLAARAFVEKKKGSLAITKSEFVFRVQKGIREILWLEAKKQEREAGLKEELDNLKKKAQYRIDLLVKTKPIRKDWEEALLFAAVQEEMKELYLRMSNVVCATCSGIASNENAYFHQREYDYVIVDEAAKCAALDLLIPMTMGKKIILVGDHKQLYPMVERSIQDEMSQEELLHVRDSILFKQLFEGNVPKSCKILLNVQYRMDELLCDFVSETFYEGQLKNGIGKRPHGIPGILSTMVFLDCPDSKEERKGTSFKNMAEALVTMRLLEQINRLSREKKTVGIISAYKGQADLLTDMSQEYPMLDIESSTVDAFQGKEKQIIILNLVRSKGFTAFARDENRFNVAVSRAQELLLVVGAGSCVERETEGALLQLYQYLKKKGLVIHHSAIELWGIKDGNM